MDADHKLIPHGDRAVDIVFDEVISEEVSSRVIGLLNVVLDEKPEGVIGALPAYRTLTVEYDPLLMTYGQVCLFLRGLKPLTGSKESGRLVRIPVCYSEGFGPDLGAVSEHAGLSREEVIRRHTSADYRVYMLGFRPGFPYLGGLDPAIACPRRGTPRQRVEGGSVGIAGNQTGVYPETSPGGWNIIGRTPLRLFDEESGTALLSAGDTVRFEEIPESVFETIVRGGEGLDRDDR